MAPIAGKENRHRLPGADVHKYHVFALRAIKLCVEQLGSRNSSSHLLVAAMTCSQAIGHEPVDNMSDVLCVEKLFFHLAGHALRLGKDQAAAECCYLIQDRLQKCKKEESRAEVTLLRRNTSSLLWRVSVSREDSSGKVFNLEMKKRAIEMLFPDAKGCAELAIRTDFTFLQVSRGPLELAKLCAFHCELLARLTWDSEGTGQETCGTASSVHQWLLLAVRGCLRSKQQGEGRGLLNKAHLTLVGHKKHCHRKEHRTHVFQQKLLQLVLEIQPSRKSQSTPVSIETLNTCADLVECSLEDSSQLRMTRELMREAVMAVRDHLKECPENSCSFTPESFLPVKRLLLGYVKCLDVAVCSRQEATKVSVDRRSQLATLNIINSILLSLLQTHTGEKEDLAPQNTHNPKAGLVDECVPLLRKSQEILKAGSFPAVEYRWLGIMAYNLGLSAHQAGFPSHAAQVLEISCELLAHWSHHSEREADQAGLQDQVRVKLM